MDTWQLNFFMDLNAVCTDFAYSEIYGGMNAEDKADSGIDWTFQMPVSGHTVTVTFERGSGNGVTIESSCLDAIEAFCDCPVYKRLIEVVVGEYETELTVSITGTQEDDNGQYLKEFRWDEQALEVIEQ